MSDESVMEKGVNGRKDSHTLKRARCLASRSRAFSANEADDQVIRSCRLRLEAIITIAYVWQAYSTETAN